MGNLSVEEMEAAYPTAAHLILFDRYEYALVASAMLATCNVQHQISGHSWIIVHYHHTLAPYCIQLAELVITLLRNEQGY
jgi:hypothetical protein